MFSRIILLTSIPLLVASLDYTAYSPILNFPAVVRSGLCCHRLSLSSQRQSQKALCQHVIQHTSGLGLFCPITISSPTCKRRENGRGGHLFHKVVERRYGWKGWNGVGEGMEWAMNGWFGSSRMSSAIAADILSPFPGLILHQRSTQTGDSKIVVTGSCQHLHTMEAYLWEWLFLEETTVTAPPP